MSPSRVRAEILAAVFALLLAAPTPARAGGAPAGASPGRASGSSRAAGRQPGGWGLTPVGRASAVGSFPLELVASPDGARLALVHAGPPAGVSVVDLASGEVREIPVSGAWMGAAFLDGGRRLATSGGLANVVRIHELDAPGSPARDSLVLGPAWSAGGQYPQGRRVDYGPGAIWPTGLSVDDPGGRLFVVSRLDSAVRVFDLRRWKLAARRVLPGVPYACLADPAHRRVFVSLWDAAQVVVADDSTLAPTRIVRVGPHPTAMALGPDGGRLFVAEANRNTVSVVDLETGRVDEVVDITPGDAVHVGATPCALALDGPRGRLYVAEADANCIAVVDVATRGHSRLLGFLPTVRYPTALALLPGGDLVIAGAKAPFTRPSSAAAPDTGGWCGYLGYGGRVPGTLVRLRCPDAAALARGTRQVLANRPPPAASAALRNLRGVGRTPIRHVFYVFKENRSYDQVLGDDARGDGDPSLCLFGARVTPNHHALAREFVLLDRMYCDADGSADGHNWGMGAYSDDYVTRSVGTSPIYDYEGGNPLAYPPSGYLWDACARAGVSFRSYGEFVFNPDDPRDTVTAGVAALAGHTAPHYRGYDPSVSDLERYRAWLEEFDGYDRDGGLPALSIIRLPNDHTEGTCTGRPTPRAHVAENDLALGLMVERISHSRYWNQSVVFVVEDDASNGPDHVDAHRTVALVAGPNVRRGAVDHTPYTVTGILRTIETILGLAPLSRFDAEATPLAAVFAAVPDRRPFAHRPALVPLDETNVAGAWGQARCDAMNWRVADAVPADEVNEILWRATRGADAPPPPRVRSAWALGAAPPLPPTAAAGGARFARAAAARLY